MRYSNIYQEVQPFGLRAAHVIGVVPGETVRSLSLSGVARTGTVGRGILNAVSFSISAFYVPFRLCFPQQEDWNEVLMRNVAPPTNTAPFVPTMERGTRVRSALPRRAFKLVYNQYFGDETVGNAGSAFYADPFLDSGVAECRTRSTEHWLKNAVLDTDYTQDTFQAPVASNIASIPLGDFARAQAANRNRMREGLVGDKYVDQMRLFGVDLDWRIQMAPEFLGAKTITLDPMTTNLIGAADAGVPGGSYWTGKVEFEITNKRFAEHGLILILITMRHPNYFAAASMPASDPAISRALSTADGIYRPVRAEEPPLVVNNDLHGGAAGTFSVPPNAPYLYGEDIVGSVQDPANMWLTFMASGSPSASMYPQTGLTWRYVNGAALAARVKLDGSTPAARNH